MAKMVACWTYGQTGGLLCLIHVVRYCSRGKATRVIFCNLTNTMPSMWKWENILRFVDTCMYIYSQHTYIYTESQGTQWLDLTKITPFWKSKSNDALAMQVSVKNTHKTHNPFVLAFLLYPCLPFGVIVVPSCLVHSCFFLNQTWLFSRGCVEECEKTGCAAEKCFQHCNFSSDGNPIDGPWYLQEPLYQQWKKWDCRSDCRYFCMLVREEEREKLGDKPVKYHGKWPFRRVFGIQVLTLHWPVINFSVV